MAYDNLTNIPTSKSGTWSTGLGYFEYGDVISLEPGIPHKDQLEVERIFALPSSPDVASKITVFDLHRIFIVNKNDYTVNETTGRIISLTPSNPTTRTYTLTGGDLVGTVVTIPVIANGEALVVRRKTFSSGKYVTWSAGTRLTSEQLNLQVNQLIKLNQELIYKLESEYLRSGDVTGSSAPAFGVNNSLDMNTNKIVNLGLASSGSDAVNVDYANANYLQIGGAVAQSITGAKTFSNAVVTNGTLTSNGAFSATGGATTNTLIVTGTTQLNGGLTMDTSAFTVADTTGNTSIGGTLAVTGATQLNGGLTMDTDRFIVQDTTGNTTIAGTLAVTGATQLNGGLTMDSTAFTVADTTGNTGIAGTLTVTGATQLNGGLTMDGTAFTVADTTGNTSVGGTLSVTGTTSFTGAPSYAADPASANVLARKSYVDSSTRIGATAIVIVGNGAIVAQSTSGQFSIVSNQLRAPSGETWFGTLLFWNSTDTSSNFHGNTTSTSGPSVLLGNANRYVYAFIRIS